jgi:hypothetical protein
VRYRKSFAEEHPILLGLGIIFGMAAVVAWWPLFLTLGVLAGFGYAAYRIGVSYREQRTAQQAYRRALAAHADYEHHLWMQGNPIGFYGQYPPAI